MAARYTIKNGHATATATFGHWQAKRVEYRTDNGVVTLILGGLQACLLSGTRFAQALYNNYLHL